MTVVSRAAAAAVAVVVAAAVLVGLAAPAAAHPLGNFTINRYARVEVSAGVARVHYVLDLAEIPAFQVRDEVDADPDAFARAQVEDIRSGLTLEVDGVALPLEAVDHRLARPEGEAGLATLRLDVVYEAPLPAVGSDEPMTARFVDGNGGGRIGWREVVAVARGDARIDRSTVPATDLTDALRTYPEDRLRSPLVVQEAELRFRQGTEAVAAAPIREEAGGRIGDFFTDLVDRQGLTPLVLAGMLGLAALAGAGHALAPGHGKTVMAAYLIGTRGRPIDAVLLGVIVSAMHTTSVLLLGVALYQVDQNVALEGLYPILTLVSGIGVLVVGAWLALTRARAFRARRAPDHDHGHGTDHDHDHANDHGPAVEHVHGAGSGHDHGHAHDHDHDRQLVGASSAAAPMTGPAGTDQPDVPHGHDGLREPHHGAHDHHGGDGHRHGPGGHSHELPEGVAPLSRRGLVLLATAGGVVPSPSAVIVLVSAFTLGRIGLGLALVAAFSIGLAATLTAVGLALVVGSQALGDRLSTRLVRVFPLLGAAALLVLGLVLVVRGVIDL